MSFCKNGNGFQFEDDFIVDKYIGKVLTDKLVFESDVNRSLLDGGEFSLRQLDHHRVFINFFRKAKTQLVMNVISTSYNSVGYIGIK